MGALNLLANNPDASQSLLETRGPKGRRLIIDTLEDDGITGKAAAAALEVGLDNLDRPGSEKTLELVVRATASGALDLPGAGKQALARLLSSQQGVTRLMDVADANIKARQRWTTDYAGFRVPGGTVKSRIGRILDDATARGDFLQGLAEQTADSLGPAADQLASSPIEGNLEAAMHKLKTSIRRSQRLSQLIAEGVKEPTGEKVANAFLVAGLNLAVSEAAKLIPGAYAGKFIAEKVPETAGTESITKILERILPILIGAMLVLSGCSSDKNNGGASPESDRQSVHTSKDSRRPSTCLRRRRRA